MKLIFLGGVKGVGKTALLARLGNRAGKRIKLLDPGTLFRRYFYDKKVKTTEEIEEMIADTVLSMPRDSTVILHWHFAVRRPSGYIPQISFSRLRRIAKSSKIKKVVLVMLEAPTHIIRERRTEDYLKKKRAISVFAIGNEIAAEKKFLSKHRILFSKILGARKVAVRSIINIDIKKAEEEASLLFFYVEKLDKMY